LVKDVSESTPLKRFAVKVAAAFQDLEHELSGGAAPSAMRRGRPRAQFTREKVLILREAGLSWRDIAQELGVGRTTVRRIHRELRSASS
jgi:DNA invertase Pin-like site-specific DNA recombinase